MIIDIDGKSNTELKRLLEVVKTSDAPIEIRERNILNIENKLFGQNNKELIEFIDECQADIDDIN